MFIFMVWIFQSLIAWMKNECFINERYAALTSKYLSHSPRHFFRDFNLLPIGIWEGDYSIRLYSLILIVVHFMQNERNECP